MLKIKRLIVTVYYLKSIQIFMRLYYLFRKKIRKLTGFRYPLFLDTSSHHLYFLHSIVHPVSYIDREFNFLNISASFPEDIDWNYKDHGKLWTYNLSYFDFLHQQEINHETALALMENYVDNIQHINDGLESFPIALRGINWVKYMSIHNIDNQRLDDSLCAQYYILLDNLEYHLLGNHLLENGFSLLFGAYYFKDEKLYNTAKKILVHELKEQILNDGAHFELSPMYHQIMLYRILDCINLVQNNDWKKQELLSLLTNKSEIMLGWLDTVTFNNGNIPLLNDSTNHIAPTTHELNEYANSLNIKTKKLELRDSGYRKIENKNYEMILDVGNIGPDYIPGHAHSDTFNFELYIEGKPFIVDTGLSTYETNKRRILERATASHNTVQLEDMEQSEVWGGFRVASRAKITNLVEKENYISAIHDGYKKKLGAMHQRKFIFENNSIKVVDTIHSKKRYNAVARLHFYPDINVEKRNNVIICDDIQLYSSSSEIEILRYQYAPEFNKTILAWMIEIKFNDKLELEMQI